MTKYRVLSRARAFALLPALSLLALARLSAQAVPSTPSSSAAKPSADETIELSPFVIEADEDEGYSAKNTLAGTRLRTELKDVGSAISVVTQKFLKDTNSKSSADLLVYTTGTEVAGQGGNFGGGGDGAIIQDGSYNRPVANTRVRGLAAADNLRDFFLTDIPWDSYNVGRVDLQRGPNSILFGIGSPAGVINSSLNTASFRDANKVELQVATFGSVRGVVDFNKVILRDELAVRVSALMDNTNYRMQPAYRDDHRMYGAVNWQPKLFSKGSAKTSIRAHVESGDIKGINPRYTPPMDAISPWFTSMNKATYDWQNNSQVTDRANARYSPYVCCRWPHLRRPGRGVQRRQPHARHGVRGQPVHVPDESASGQQRDVQRLVQGHRHLQQHREQPPPRWLRDQSLQGQVAHRSEHLQLLR